MTKSNAMHEYVNSGAISEIARELASLKKKVQNSVVYTSAGGQDTQRVRGLVINPQDVYTLRPQIPVMRTDGNITIIRIHIYGPDLSPTTELLGDLKFANDLSAFAGATVIAVCDTTNGVRTITSGFTDATVPTDKYVYFQMDSSPHADWTEFYIEIFFTYG